MTPASLLLRALRQDVLLHLQRGMTTDDVRKFADCLNGIITTARKGEITADALAAELAEEKEIQTVAEDMRHAETVAEMQSLAELDAAEVWVPGEGAGLADLLAVIRRGTGERL